MSVFDKNTSFRWISQSKNRDEDSELVFLAMDSGAQKGVVKASADATSTQRLLMPYCL